MSFLLHHTSDYADDRHHAGKGILPSAARCRHSYIELQLLRRLLPAQFAAVDSALLEIFLICPAIFNRHTKLTSRRSLLR